MGGRSKSSSSQNTSTTNFSFTPVDNRIAENGSIGDSFSAGGNVNVTQTDGGAVADALNFAGQTNATAANQIAALTGQALDSSANNVAASFGFAAETQNKSNDLVSDAISGANSLSGDALSFTNSALDKSYGFVSDTVDSNYRAFDNVLAGSLDFANNALTAINTDRARNTQNQENFIAGFSDSIAQQTQGDREATTNNLNTLIYAAAAVAGLYAIRGAF